jgi:type II secretory pathway component PulF
MGREKAAHYRMWHLRVHTGLAWSEERAPGTPVAFETALVELGGESGKLEDCLRLLADYFAAEDRMIQRLLARMSYPMLVLLVGCVIGPLQLAVMGHVTAYFVLAGSGLALLALGGGSLLMGALQWYLNQPKYVLGRLLRALTFAIEAGLALGRAAQLAADATGNAAVIAHVRARTRQAGIQPLAQTFAGCPHVPPHALAALEVAEATGDYTNTLRRMAELTES